ncbi:MAG: SMI1/KNR4 family protein, partial [Isosphaeraceae bacterium]|nr:SMI1/KNR4 family protein [Isosphaeraceae bacterium]
MQVRESGPPLADGDLIDLEQRLGIELPPDYRAFLLSHNGGVPRPEWFRLPVRDEWLAMRRSVGRMRGLGQSYLNASMVKQWKAWHRIIRFPGVGTGPDGADFERAFHDRPPGLPEGVAVIAEVGSFQINGWLCIDVSGGPGHGRVLYWPDVTPGLGVVAAAPVAPSFGALTEALRPLGDPPPEWLSLVEDGDLDALRRWVERNGRRLREKDKWEWTALDHAVFEERWEIAAFLMEKRNATPEMVFYDALVDGRFPTARGMLHFGVNAEFLEPALARKADEFWADLGLVRAFVDAGANVDHVDNDASPGNTPLHFAADVGAVEAVRLLLDRGADPTVKNDEGLLPRDLAARAGCAEAAALLDQAAAARPAPPDTAAEVQEVDLHKVTITDALPGLGEDALKALEQRLGTRLPGEYRAFLKRFNGGTPRPARFGFKGDDGEGETICEVTRFLSVGGVATALGETVDLETVREELADWGIPKRLLPIASAADEFFGGLLCISLRGKDRGRIVYYPQNDSTDSSTYRVVKSLSGFFALLSKSKRKTPAWVVAIEEGKLGALQEWLDEGGTLNTRHRGRTPLELAVQKGRTEVVRWLIARGIKAEDAFQTAMESGQDAIMLELLGAAEVRKLVPKNVLGVFFFAPGVWRNAELMRQFVALGVDLNAAGGPGLTPLMLAAQHASADVVRFLLAHGARAGQWSPQGEMALHRAACAAPRAEMVEKIGILIDAGQGLHDPAPHSALPDHLL